jgi:hypothetical protein
MTNYSNENLQGRRFTDENLQNVSFHGADLRGVDFSSARLKGADFSQSKQGISFSSRIVLFILTLIVSCISGYIAMLAGTSVQYMLNSPAEGENIAGYVTIGFFVIFVAVCLWKGMVTAIKHVSLILIGLPVVLSAIIYFSHLGTGKGALYCSVALLLTVLMFIVGTIARATVGTMGSNILFVIVALGGGMFGKSLGGGIGTVVMAVMCAIISKRALQAGKDTLLRQIAVSISTRFGTSFKHADLTNANFSDTQIKHTDFSHAILTGVNWTNCKKEFIVEANDNGLAERTGSLSGEVNERK